MNFNQKNDPSKTIARSLRTASLIDAFWDRWRVHGLEESDLDHVKSELNSLQLWTEKWEKLALEQLRTAEHFELIGDMEAAENQYRKTSLYFNLIYWIYPENWEAKQTYYKKSLHYIHKADALSSIERRYETLVVDGNKCPGRISIPRKPEGCILIINPIDSSKEELFKYEQEFLNEGFVTFSFDGPGQGESYCLNNMIGTKLNWEKFINQYINYSYELFPDLPIYLFGTSIGASWALYGSGHKKVTKAIAVSPAIELEKMNMPGYFLERLKSSCIVENKEERAIPSFEKMTYQAPVIVFHGNKDMMVPDERMYELFDRISVEKQLIEYEEEGHCCNHRLEEIRSLSMDWFKGNNITKGVNLLER